MVQLYTLYMEDLHSSFILTEITERAMHLGAQVSLQVSYTIPHLPSEEGRQNEREGQRLL